MTSTEFGTPLTHMNRKQLVPIAQYLNVPNDLSMDAAALVTAIEESEEE